jgi:hypothetical protein
MPSKPTTTTLSCAAAFALAAASALPAERLSMGGAGEPVFADRETSAAFALPEPGENGNWRLTLTLDGTPSNAVELAFGRDSNSNAVLDVEEICASVGWDRGVWFAGGAPALSERFTAAPSGHSLTLDVRIPKSGAAPSAAFSGNGAPIAFAGLPKSPAWLDPRQWDTAVLTARGGGARAEAAEIRVFPGGTTIILK